MTVGELREMLKNPSIEDRYQVAVEFVRVSSECEHETVCADSVRLDFYGRRAFVIETNLIGLPEKARA